MFQAVFTGRCFHDASELAIEIAKAFKAAGECHLGDGTIGFHQESADLGDAQFVDHPHEAFAGGFLEQATEGGGAEPHALGGFRLRDRFG